MPSEPFTSLRLRFLNSMQVYLEPSCPATGPLHPPVHIPAITAHTKDEPSKWLLIEVIFAFCWQRRPWRSESIFEIFNLKFKQALHIPTMITFNVSAGLDAKACRHW